MKCPITSVTYQPQYCPYKVVYNRLKVILGPSYLSQLAVSLVPPESRRTRKQFARTYSALTRHEVSIKKLVHGRTTTATLVFLPRTAWAWIIPPNLNVSVPRLMSAGTHNRPAHPKKSIGLRPLVCYNDQRARVPDKISSSKCARSLLGITPPENSAPISKFRLNASSVRLALDSNA